MHRILHLLHFDGSRQADAATGGASGVGAYKLFGQLSPDPSFANQVLAFLAAIAVSVFLPAALAYARERVRSRSRERALEAALDEAQARIERMAEGRFPVGVPAYRPADFLPAPPGYRVPGPTTPPADPGPVS